MIITLIGMPAVGKSYFGRALAKRLGFDFVDLDKVIQDRFSKSLQVLIDEMGETAFIELEGQMAQDMVFDLDTIFSPGGSIVYDAAAMEWLAEHSLVVYLKESLDVISGRMPNLETRGVIGMKGDGLAGVYAERVPLFESYAHITVDLKRRFNVEVVVDQLVDAVRSHSPSIGVSDV